MPSQGDTLANDVLNRLLNISEGDRLNVLSVATEYSDHPSLANKAAMPSGDRLMLQLQFALHEVLGDPLQGRARRWFLEQEGWLRAKN